VDNSGQFTLTYDLEPDDLADFGNIWPERKRRRRRTTITVIVWVLVALATLADMFLATYGHPDASIPLWTYVVEILAVGVLAVGIRQLWLLSYGSGQAP
jgi:hypothetical protein